MKKVIFLMALVLGGIESGVAEAAQLVACDAAKKVGCDIGPTISNCQIFKSCIDVSGRTCTVTYFEWWDSTGRQLFNLPSYVQVTCNDKPVPGPQSGQDESPIPQNYEEGQTQEVNYFGRR